MASIPLSRTPSVYQIRHIASGKVYVGSAVDPHRRCGEHVRDLRKREHHTQYLQHAWDKYGEDAFVFEIIEPVLFCEDLTTRETYWIKTLRAADRKYGYNVLPIAGSSLGTKHTDEQRAAQSERGKARFADPAERAKVSERQKVLCASPDYRAKVSERQKARFADPVERAKSSERAKVQYSDPEVRAKAAKRAMEQYVDPETRAKVSARSKAQWADPEARATITAALKRRYIDPEARAKAAERTKAQFANPEARANLSATQKALWADPTYRAKMKKAFATRKKKT